MKLKLLAIAIVAAATPFAAQAEFTVGGDVGIGYFQHSDGETFFGGHGSEVTFDANQKVGGLTYFGHFEVNVAGATVNDTVDVDDETSFTLAGTLSSDDMFVGVKGAFGEVRLGDTDNGCDAVDTGWVADDEYISHSSGGCKAGDQNNVTYKGSRGPVSYAASFSPDVDNGSAVAGEDAFAVGIKGKVGPATVSLGYETETSVGSNVVLGVSGAFGPIAVGIRANNADDSDTNIGYTAQYAAGGNKFYIGVGDVDDNDTLFLGYQRKLGSRTTFIAEWVEDDSATDDQVGIGFKHAF
jgi:hypothetical protein